MRMTMMVNKVMTESVSDDDDDDDDDGSFSDCFDTVSVTSDVKEHFCYCCIHTALFCCATFWPQKSK